MYNAEIAQQLETLITKALVARLEAQGHKASGKGSKSLETKVRESGQGLLIAITGEDYLQYQETGRTAGKLPNIDALAKWVKQKGIASEAKEVKRIAWAIGKNMQKIGMHSTNKRIDLRKRHFITNTLENGKNLINKKLFEMFDKNFDLLVTQHIKDSQVKSTIRI